MISQKQIIVRLVKIVLLFSFCLLTFCSDHIVLGPLLKPETGTLQGQVYNLSHPGPIPIGWIPPAYETVCTVIAQDVNQRIIVESETNRHGKFYIILKEGVYYLRVKESNLSSETGPFNVRKGEVLEAKAYFDNGMR
jgi:hypothetical protein